MLAWVYFGLRLRKIPFRSLLGSIPGDFRSIAVDLGIAMVFWIGSLMVLGTIAIFWTVIEAAITHRSLLPSGKPLAPDAAQQQTLHTLLQLAPANGREIAAWIVVCIIAGIVEEIVFRGYLQRQFTAWARARWPRAWQSPRCCSAPRMDTRARAAWFCSVSSECSSVCSLSSAAVCARACSRIAGRIFAPD